MARPTAAIIHLDNIAYNFKVAQGLTPSGDCIAVVKANAYGHGAVEVASHLAPIAACFAVCSCEEAAQLRLAGIEHPILLLEGGFAEDDLLFASEQGCWLTLADMSQVKRLSRAQLPKPVRVFIKVDTGMHRMGIPPACLDDVIQRLLDMSHVQGEPVLMTHYACADEPQHPTMLQQLNLLETLQEKTSLAVSAANSATILTGRARAERWSRPGIMLYGSDPLIETNEHARRLRPAMSLVSEVIGIRDIAVGESVGYGATWTAARASRIATVAVGYADGYPRAAASGTPVFIDGHVCPLAGRVSMDMISVDVTDCPSAGVGSHVELWGENISVDTVAQFAGTIAYELLARMPMRAPRLYRCASNASLP